MNSLMAGLLDSIEHHRQMAASALRLGEYDRAYTHAREVADLGHQLANEIFRAQRNSGEVK